MVEKITMEQCEGENVIALKTKYFQGNILLLMTFLREEEKRNHQDFFLSMQY